MSSHERRAIANAIWLCQNCAKLIDSDTERFTVMLLREWKLSAEKPLKIGSNADLKQGESDPPNAQHEERIVLGLYNELVTTVEDLRHIVTRSWLCVLRDEQPTFRVELQAIEFPETEDPIQTATYGQSRKNRSLQLQAALEALFSLQARESWGPYLSKVDNLLEASQELVNLTRLGAAWTALQKLDVWRTQSPELHAPVYLSEDEAQCLLDSLGFAGMHELRFGAGWRDAADVPEQLLTRKILPRIALEVARRGVPLDHKVLSLTSWHIGQG